MERYELEMVVGGITYNTPWSKKIALTGPYFEERIVGGVPASTPPPADVKGLEVAAPRGEVIAAYLQRKGAVPVRVDDLSQANGPAAAPEWKLEQATDLANSLDWRLYDVNLVAVRSLD